VKAAKPLIVLFGVMGLISLFLPMDPLPSLFSMLMEIDKLQLVLMLAAFGLPTIAGVAALSKPPAQAWQAVAALAGFGLAAVKTHIWETGPHIMDVPLGMKLMIVATVGGVIVSIMGLVKPEDRA
jgi:hypothetical protein